MTKNKIMLLVCFFGVLIRSFIGNMDTWSMWLMEVAPGLLYLLSIILLYKRFRFTEFTLLFILLHCIILFVGAKYTYAEVPLFNWIRDYFDMSRNNYDKVGHFAQGFVPALVAREIIARLEIVKSKGWMNFFIICICLAISALYEIIEWFAAVTIENAEDDFVGAQGYVWDAQSDMLFALIGACLMLAILSKLQDKYIHRGKVKK